LEYNLQQKNRLLREIYDAETFTVDAILHPYRRYAGWLAPYITDTALLLSRWIDAGASVLFEGAQGTMLDMDHGTYPFITSSSTTAGGASTGTGVPPTKIHGVLGISKAYSTRVGEGPFPTELHGAGADLLRTRGNEFGSVTGRPRRCGWVDAVGLRYAARVNGFDSLALTKLDVLDEYETVKICVGYRYGGDVLTDFPEEERIWREAEPVYEELSGWQSSTHGLRDYGELPTKARSYLDRLSELCGVPFGLVSTGAGRDAMMLTPDSVLTRWYPALRGGLSER
ncbi:MAG TPA: adenylosuccinate synthetase, partial [Candidatus Methylomirabilis sp.]|nr:adenylosuccinate synthetase [Candidatus Methylomirabilis sp.]